MNHDDPMAVENEFAIEIEPERYELLESPFDAELARRDFLKVLGGGLLIFCLGPEIPLEAQESGGGSRRNQSQRLPREIGAWLHIGEDGVVTGSTGKVEVGQNARASLMMAVADELNLPVESVRLVMGDTDHVPFDMGTFGSLTTPRMVPQMRRAAAAARNLLIRLAAERWGVDRGSLTTSGGKVQHAASGRSAGFGELTQGRKLIETIGEDTPTMPASEWKVAGRTVPKPDARAMVTGAHRYPIDQTRPGMLRGKVLRPPSYGAKLASVDVARAEMMQGFKVVRDGDFVGVVAANEFEAAAALAAISARWEPAKGPAVSDGQLAAYLREHPEEGSRNGRKPSEETDSSVQKELDASTVRVSAVYTVAYIAHAPLEPRSALAEWNGDRLTVWTGTQRPFGARSELAAAFRLPEESIRVIVPDTGSGYGGKHTNEAAVEAARLARHAGKPVKLTWTREEEFTWAYFRPAGVIEASGGADRQGKLTGWDFHNYNSGGSGLTTPYKVPSSKVVFHATASPLRQGSYRALAATANHFARESLMDELAHAAGVDPLEFRLRNLENPRLRAVFEAAAGAFGWKSSKPAPGHGFGIAGGAEKGGYIATCTEVAVDPQSNALRVVRVVAAFECGAIVNPDQLENQVKGCLIMGLGGALYESIQFQDGKLLNPRFSRYRVPRFADIPTIDVVLIDRRDLPAAGAGEIPIVAIAPALAGAIFQATGHRLRSMPLAPDGIIKG